MRYNYNLSGSSRKPLVDTMSQILNQPAVYQGAPSFSYAIGDYTVDRNGVLSYGNNIHPDYAAVLVSDLQERGFVAEKVDDAADVIADADDITNAEIVTENPPEAIDMAENTTEPADSEEVMSENDANDEETPKTMAENVADTESPNILTVEIPDAGFTPEAKENLQKIVASKKTILEKALETDGLPIVEKDNKITFPWFTLHGIDGEADAYSRLVTAICKMAKEQKRVTATEKPIENEKFTMRLFLIRLGFIGDEFKTARKILLRNLSGNSSWKSGHKPERNTDAVIPPNPAKATLPTSQELVTPLEEVGSAEAKPQKEDEGDESYDK